MNKILVSEKAHFWYSAEMIIKNISLALPSWEIIKETKEIKGDDIVLILCDGEKWEEKIEEIPFSSRLLIPIFGNLTIEIDRWLKLKNKLKNRKVKFLCGSQRQLAQTRFLLGKQDCFEIPFPLSSSGSQCKGSKKLKFLYAGRLTEQKNIHILIKQFYRLTHLYPGLVELHLAGHFHDRGYHLHGSKRENYKDFIKGLCLKSPDIKYHGPLNQAELESLILNTNISVSLSTYHDEDYGLSVAQGLIHGHIALLSDWGGHGNYLNHFFAKSVSVGIENRFPILKEENFIKASTDLFPLVKNKSREQLDIARKYFSQENFKNKLEEKCKESWNEFQQISPFYQDYLEVAQKSYPFHPDIEKDLYYPIYQHYLE